MTRRLHAVPSFNSEGSNGGAVTERHTSYDRAGLLAQLEVEQIPEVDRHLHPNSDVTSEAA